MGNRRRTTLDDAIAENLNAICNLIINSTFILEKIQHIKRIGNFLALY